jgi:hypothetical protein
MDTDNLLALVRESLGSAAKAHPGSAPVKRAHEAFARLDTELCGGGDLPEDWLTDDDDAAGDADTPEFPDIPGDDDDDAPDFGSLEDE